ncbi:MAG: hypothetical protein ICV83_13550 [Cytophagales bacterium]|nr:hypothetical protein [Cytophagales bacterium]
MASPVTLLLRWLRGLWNGANSSIGALLLVGVLVSTFFIAYKIHNDYLEEKAAQFILPYEKGNQAMRDWVLNHTDTSGPAESRLNIFKTQFRLIAERKQHHIDLAKYFLANYYASTLILMFSSICGGIVVFIIANKGWATTSANLKAVFFVLFFATTFWGLFPNVFGQQANYQENLRKYLAYDALQVEIFNHLSTQNSLDITGKKIGTDSLITIINKRIIDYGDIIITVDATKVGSIEEISRQIGKTTASP